MEYGSDERLELALRASNEGIWDWDLKSDQIEYSARVLMFLRYKREEMPHLFRDPEIVHEDDREKFREAVAKALEPNGEHLLAVVPRIRTSGGDWRWLRIRGIVVRDEEGRAVRLAGSVIDVSKRKAIEEQLEEERHLMRHLIDHVPLNIYFKDLESRFTIVNQAQATYFGESSEEGLRGKTDHDFLEHSQAERILADERKILETGEPILGMVEPVKVSEHEQAWFLVTKMPRYDREGVLRGTFGISSNVSELVKTQRSLVLAATKLKRRNEEIEEEMLLAREVQQALLPHEYPTVPSGVVDEESAVHFGYRYIPISGLAGDFFEVFEIKDGQIGMFICDVMGHGVRSAVIVSMLRGLAERAAKSAEDPAAFLSELNAGLSGILSTAGVTMFATAFFAVADFNFRELRYASAGHPAGIVCGPEGASILPLGGRGAGPALGLFGGGVYETHSVRLLDVQRLLLFTDGIFEVENQAGEALLQNRLVDVISHAGGAGIEETLDDVLQRVLSFAEKKHFDDDVCLLGMEISRQWADASE
jgi:sigma-B regulation protein RsbU (phosphoserine phosphatase)